MQEFDLENRAVRLPAADGSFPHVRSVASDAECLRVTLDVTPDLNCFSGHFPGQPVLPGVVQLHWAVLVAEAWLGWAGVPAEIKRLKFKKVLTPPQDLELTLRQCGPAEAQFRFSYEGDEYSEGRLVFPGDTA